MYTSFHDFIRKLWKSRTCTIISFSGRDCVLMILFQLYRTNTGLFKVICFGWVNMTPPHNLNIGSRANPILLLIYNSLATYLNNFKSKNCWYYHIDSDFISFFVAIKGKKTPKLIKIIKIEAKIHIFWVIWWISIKFSGKFNLWWH